MRRFAIMGLILSAAALLVTTIFTTRQLKEMSARVGLAKWDTLGVITACMRFRDRELEIDVQIAQGQRPLADLVNDMRVCSDALDAMAKIDPQRKELWANMKELFNDDGILRVNTLRMDPAGVPSIRRIQRALSDARSLLGQVIRVHEDPSKTLDQYEPQLRQTIDDLLQGR